MNRSETLGKLAEALSKAQKEIKGALKDSSNPFFKSKFADLESCWEACREPLSKNGLSITQGHDCDDKADYLITTLMHSSGEWVSYKQRLIFKEPTAQAMGAATTYARRFGLTSAIGIVQVDDDGNEASGRQGNGANSGNQQQTGGFSKGMAQGFRK